MKDKEFLRGYICAVATICRQHDPGTPIEDALKEIGSPSVQEMRDIGVEEFDIEALKPTVQFMNSQRGGR